MWERESVATAAVAVRHDGGRYHPSPGSFTVREACQEARVRDQLAAGASIDEHRTSAKTNLTYQEKSPSFRSVPKVNSRLYNPRQSAVIRSS